MCFLVHEKEVRTGPSKLVGTCVDVSGTWDCAKRPSLLEGETSSRVCTFVSAPRGRALGTRSTPSSANMSLKVTNFGQCQNRYCPCCTVTGVLPFVSASDASDEAFGVCVGQWIFQKGRTNPVIHLQTLRRTRLDFTRFFFFRDLLDEMNWSVARSRSWERGKNIQILEARAFPRSFQFLIVRKEARHCRALCLCDYMAVTPFRRRR